MFNRCQFKLLRVAITLFVASLCCACTNNENPRITFLPLSYSEWINTLQEYKPKIVVVDMWATWCASCLEEFPKMVELQRHYKDQDVEFVSMNLDDHSDQSALDDAKIFLQKMNANFDNFWMDENLMVAFKQLDLIGIPAVVIYDRDGKERYRLTGDNPNKQFYRK